MQNKEFRQQLINRSFSLSEQVIQLVDKFPSKRSFWVISDQLIRAATSIGANIVEAQAASSRKDFTNFLNYALKSGNETIYWLSLTQKIAPEFKKEMDGLLAEVVELTKILGSSVISLKRKF